MTNNFFEVIEQPASYPYFEKQDAVILNFRPNYESVENHQTLHNQVVKSTKARIQRIRTWYEFTESIRDERPALITIHYSVINYGTRHVSEFISFIQGLTEYMTKNNVAKMPIPIAIEVDALCPVELVTVLQHTDAVGIVPTADSFGVERAADALVQLLKIKEYWPADIINQLPSHPPSNKPINLYFRKHWKTYLSPESRIQMHKNIPWDPMYCDSWDKFVIALRDTPPHQIEFHVSLLEEDGISPKDLVSLITNLTSVKCHKKTPIAAVIEPDTPLSLVKKLKAAGVFGIVPSSTGFGTDSTRVGMQSLFDRVPYWPEHILNRLPNDTKPTHIYFRQDVGSYMTPAMKNIFSEQLDLDLVYCATWGELSAAVDAGAEQMAVHIDTLTHLGLTITEIISMIDTRVKLAGRTMAIMVGIEPNTPRKFINELKKTSVLGIVPSAAHWGTEEAMQAIRLLTNRQTSWPKHIIEQLPGSQPKIVKSNNGIELTARQQEVMDLICHRGLSNKQIAKTLNLSESTVKIHVSAIMRAYGVRNRTQLALSAGVGLKA